MTTHSGKDAAFWSVETNQLLSQLGSSEQGLSQHEADVRLARATRLKPRRQSALSLLIEQFKSPIMILLFCSAILSFTLIDDVTNGVIILIILVASGLLGFWQEWSAADAVAKLMGMIETKATVIREGQEKDVPLGNVVTGDVIRLRAGDLIPGDCRLLTSRDMYVNEAALTGESFPTEKTVALLEATTPLAKRSNALFLGTNVISGMGTAVVAATGPETEFGKISERLEHRQPETGFERGLRQFGQLLIKIVVVITVVVFAISGPLGQKKRHGRLPARRPALAVGMTPQLLPAITSVVLAAKAMSRHQVIVSVVPRHRKSGEHDFVLCSDKTGTLTEGIIQLHSTLT
ncbi:MAG: cation-transporting P-type ATPase [Planctomycetales bacterium]